LEYLGIDGSMILKDILKENGDYGGKLSQPSHRGDLGSIPG
jgi:hypothetical protein